MTKKFRQQVLIDGVSHAYGSGWARTFGHMSTRCGVSYTRKASRVDIETRFAGRTSRDIDCMACIAARCEP